ncbi:MAG TPA: PQQ-binding-like beta-propeller repeat protein [Dehalococcoidia bacterium]|nr:PQQ-binding-like beta-propeller repeat protein [Chloroflexota bacterium]HEX74433.1 PQQ-binding-like beta-propeller repeat protein [Dehalococcoidia bacterium]
MEFRSNKVLLVKVLLFLVILMVSGLGVFGCVGRGSIPKGWSGGVVAEDTLFLGSMKGKLVAIDILSHTRLWEVPLETSEQAGGFGCAPASTAVAIYGSPAVAEELVYVSGYNGKIYAFSVGKDEPRWVYPREDNLQPIVGGAIVAQGKVYMGCSDGKVYALDAADGYKQWEFQTGDKIWSTPVIDGDTLFIASFDKKLYALDATNGSKKWEFETGGAIASTPFVYNNTIYIGSFDRHLYAVNATDGSLVWKLEVKADKWFWTKPVICNNTIYAGNLDGKVYILNAETGDEVVDAIDLVSPISSSPVLVDDSVIIASEEGRVWTIDTSNNQESELINLGQKIYAPLYASDGVVYIHTSEGSLHALNAQSGSKLWSLSLSS